MKRNLSIIIISNGLLIKILCKISYIYILIRVLKIKITILIIFKTLIYCLLISRKEFRGTEDYI